LAFLVITVWAATLLAVGHASGAIASGDHYNLPIWITAHLSRVWLNPVARRLGGGYPAATNSQVVEFLGDASAVAAAERDIAYANASGGDTTAASAELKRRLVALNPLAWPVEDRLSAQLSTAIRSEGLGTSLPLFSRIQLVWPPVAFAYDLPPYVLVQSPRDRIELEDTTLLRSDLPGSITTQLARDVEAKGKSALVVRIGGLAAYPAIVEEDDGYADAIDVLAHEWTHQYLFFQPLGIRYFNSLAMTTINETVANMVGRELSAELRSRFPLDGTPQIFRSDAPPADRTVDVNRLLHQLRLDVDALLSQGRAAEAEQKMTDTHRFLAQRGYYLPPINQAYYAFYGSYADTAESTSPFGPRLATLRRLSPSLQAFVRSVQSVRSPVDLSQLETPPQKR
jgi:hypothetical protein